MSRQLRVKWIVATQTPIFGYRPSFIEAYYHWGEDTATFDSYKSLTPFVVWLLNEHGGVMQKFGAQEGIKGAMGFVNYDPMSVSLALGTEIIPIEDDAVATTDEITRRYCEIMLDGFEANVNSVAFDRNPYDAGSPSAKAWEHGWADAASGRARGLTRPRYSTNLRDVMKLHEAEIRRAFYDEEALL